MLDRLYREVWGEHVHHGLWVSGREPADRAARAMTELVAREARVRAGDRVVDAGCGYGATARLLARERGATVTGLTLSAAQAAAAPPADGVTILVRDWLANGLDDGAYDAAIAIESLSHMPDPPRAFGELARVVRPGGRVVLVDWLSAERPSALARRALIDPIAREGHLPGGLPTASSYELLLDGAGLTLTGFEDLTARTVRTWGVVARRLSWRFAREPRTLAEALPEWRFGLSLLRIPVAMRLGSMRLCLFVAERPAG